MIINAFSEYNYISMVPDSVPFVLQTLVKNDPCIPDTGSPLPTRTVLQHSMQSQDITRWQSGNIELREDTTFMQKIRKIPGANKPASGPVRQRDFYREYDHPEPQAYFLSWLPEEYPHLRRFRVTRDKHRGFPCLKNSLSENSLLHFPDKITSRT
jgi:hypothetical protein